MVDAGPEQTKKKKPSHVSDDKEPEEVKGKRLGNGKGPGKKGKGPRKGKGNDKDGKAKAKHRSK